MPDGSIAVVSAACSCAHQSLCTLLPSTWCAAAALPNTKSAGNSIVRLRLMGRPQRWSRVSGLGSRVGTRDQRAQTRDLFSPHLILQVEERVDAGCQLFLDLLDGSLDDVQGDAAGAAVGRHHLAA